MQRRGFDPLRRFFLAEGFSLGDSMGIDSIPLKLFQMRV